VSNDGFGRTYPFDGSPAQLPSGWIDNCGWRLGVTGKWMVKTANRLGERGLVTLRNDDEILVLQATKAASARGHQRRAHPRLAVMDLFPAVLILQ